MTLIDISAASLFFACWVLYEPVLKRLSARHGGINSDMGEVRAAWIRRLLKREVRIMDTNLLGHLLSSASFFASTNLLIIAAAAGLFFGGEAMLQNLDGVILVSAAPTWLIEVKIALVLVALSRGLLEFIWAIRQLNYCLALLGSAPEWTEPERHDDFAGAFADVLNPAFASFNKGVRAYYFALAAAAWIASPWAMAFGAAAASALLLRRQLASPAAHGVRAAKAIFEAERKADSVQS
jgi:uncharacterized membrane protein